MGGHPIFAAVYDRLLAESEEAGLRQIRAELLASARGRTLEIGSGTGANIEHYPQAVSELVLTEPDPHMAKRLRARISTTPPAIADVEVVEAPAERLPFENESFDTAVSTLVLCTVSDPAQTVAEARRVLKPGGRLLFMEHVRDEEGSRRARWQDRLERPWGWFAGSCHPNRESGILLAAAFAQVDYEPAEFPGTGTALVRPMITGIATR